jgi:hypothetical protein
MPRRVNVPRQMPSLAAMCATADRVLAIVREWSPDERPPLVEHWNDEFLVAAFARGYRCLRSVRETACRGEADDAAVLTRALVALTLRYLWVGCAEGENEGHDRLQRLRRKWASDRAVLGEELEDLGYLHRGTSREFRETADQLRAEGVPGMLDDRAIALRLDRDLDPEAPRFFELVYARIYRTTSEVAHYGLGALLQGYEVPPVEGARGELAIDRRDDERAAEALGLALLTFGALADFAEPVVRHGLTARIAEAIEQRHREPEA